jgi:glycosyltransferase involved in cell wall biosynthesis
MNITSKDIYDFHQWFSNRFRDRLASRYHTFYQALLLALVRNAKHLVETGTARDADNWAGDGESTYVFGAFARRYGCRLWTCDIEEANIATARRLTAPFKEHIEYVVSDSVEFLQKFDRPIDLLYLDSYDFEPDEDPDPPQDHALREAQAALPALHSQSIVLVDDCSLPHGGKGGKVIPFLLEKGWQLFGLGYQTLVAQPSWVRPSPGEVGPAGEATEPDRHLRAFAEDLLTRGLAAQALSGRVDEVGRQAGQGGAAGLWQQLQELARDNEARQREIAELQAVRCEAAEQVQALTKENEAYQREAAELHRAVAEQAGRADRFAAQVELMLGREKELRDMLLEAHEQLLRRDEEIQAALAQALQQAAPVVSGAVAADKGPLPGRHLPYQLLLQRIRELARGTLPADATVLVISKGDGELLKLPGRPGWHFPQNEQGVWAGYNPADGAEAVRHLEELRAKGADYLLIPATCLWWLEHYEDFRRHLEGNYRLVARQDDVCAVYSLREAASPEQRQYQQLIRQFREVAGKSLPADATVLVVSKGDPELLQLGGRRGLHFPQAEGGAYAGHHPADGAEAVRHLEELRAKGADYLLIPATCLWWLEHYEDFRRHLEGNYRLVARQDDVCAVYSLREGPGANGRSGAAREAQTAAGRPFGVNVAGNLASEKGTGEAVRATVRSLEAAGVPHVLNNFIDEYSANADRTFTQFSGESPYAINLIQVNADMVPEFVRHKGEAYLRGRYNIGYWFWELADFPEEQWRSSFPHLNEVWAPSNFVLDAISRVAPVPVVRVPLSVPEKPATKDLRRSDLGLPADRFVFLFIFDHMSITERKNPLGLIKAFKKAFRKKDKAVLVLKCSNSSPGLLQAVGSSPAVLRAIQGAAAGANVLIRDGVVSREEVNTLLALSDCYVSLHRSEGLGLTLAEAMSLDKPVIATGYSGNMDFMTPANSFLVRYDLAELERDHGPYKKGSVWADPDLDHAAELMRFVYKRRKAAKEVGRQAQEDVRRTLSPGVVGRTIKDRLLQIAAFGKAPAPQGGPDGRNGKDSTPLPRDQAAAAEKHR